MFKKLPRSQSQAVNSARIYNKQRRGLYKPDILMKLQQIELYEINLGCTWSRSLVAAYPT